MNVNNKLSLTPYYLPSLFVGEHIITVTQTLEAGTTINETFERTQKVKVSGSGYFIEQEILKVFPENNSDGKYTNLFPQIILTNKSFPWEKNNLFKNKNKETERRYPWVGLLLFRDGEGFEFKVMKKKSILEKVYYPLKKVFNPLEDEQVLVVDVDTTLFKKIAPSSEDLRLLSHVREEPPSLSHSESYLDKLKSASTESESPKCSVIACNRLPGKQQNNIVCLVSFEEWGEVLEDLDKITKDKVRLRVLKKWRFVDQTEDVRFSSYLSKIAKKDTNHTFKLDAIQGTNKQEVKEINNAIELGFTPIEHQLRNGDQTVSFYRGPLLPYAYDNTNDVKSRIILGTDSALRYNTSTGIFNESYSAAFQLGKLLALQNRSFSESVFHFRKQTIEHVFLKDHHNLKQRKLKESHSDIKPSNLEKTVIENMTEVLKSFNKKS